MMRTVPLWPTPSTHATKGERPTLPRSRRAKFGGCGGGASFSVIGTILSSSSSSSAAGIDAA